MTSRWLLSAVIAFGMFSVLSARGADEPPAVTTVYVKTGEPITQGQRIFFTGNSFHGYVPPILENIAVSAGISGHKTIGKSSIGGSKVIQHWDLPDEQNPAKKALRTGQVDVLTMSPINVMPDEGIEKFATLALENNPKIRIIVQENWLTHDVYGPNAKETPPPADHNAITPAELRARSAPSFKSIDDHIAELNQKFGKQVLFIAPAGPAVNALRARIVAGKAGQLKAQSELFGDALGHPTAPARALVAYCHFAVIYRRSPVGLPMPQILADDPKYAWNAETVRVLQEVAWEAVTQHPLSGVQAAGAAGSAK